MSHLPTYPPHLPASFYLLLPQHLWASLPGQDKSLSQPQLSNISCGPGSMPGPGGQQETKPMGMFIMNMKDKNHPGQVWRVACV